MDLLNEVVITLQNGGGPDGKMHHGEEKEGGAKEGSRGSRMQN